ICRARERWPKARRSSTPNQRRLRSSSGFFLRFAITSPSRSIDRAALELAHPEHREKRPEADESSEDPPERHVRELGREGRAEAFARVDERVAEHQRSEER